MLIPSLVMLLPPSDRSMGSCFRAGEIDVVPSKLPDGADPMSSSPGQVEREGDLGMPRRGDLLERLVSLFGSYGATGVPGG